MASTMYLLLTVFITILTFVENAPSNTKNITPDDLQMRLIFTNSNDENTINDNTGDRLSTLSPLRQKNRLSSNEQLTEPVLSANTPRQDTNSESVISTILPRMEDERQNWGLIAEDSKLNEEESYYERPLQLPKVINSQVLNHERAKVRKVAKPRTTTPAPKPSPCDIAVIPCCARELSQRKECFKAVGCIRATEDMVSTFCSDDYINKVIEMFASIYKADG